MLVQGLDWCRCGARGTSNGALYFCVHSVLYMCVFYPANGHPRWSSTIRTRRWSYIESNSPTFSYAIDDRGAPLAMTVSGGIRSCQGWRSGNVCTSVGRRDGRTLVELMELARKRCAADTQKQGEAPLCAGIRAS